MKENGFMEEFKKKIEVVNDMLTNKNLLLVLLVYIIGTIIVMGRNFYEGIPFTAYSIVSYAILTFYFVLFAGMSVFLKYSIETIMQNEYQGSKLVRLIKKIGSSVVVILIIAAIMLYIMKLILYNTSSSLVFAYAFWLYCILPLAGFLKNYKKIKEFSVLMSVLFTFGVIFNIPTSIGGLKEVQVKFYSYNDNIIYDYLYYGETNGNYIFKENKNKIISRSCDSGYIEYYRDDNIEDVTTKYKVKIKETFSKVVEIEAKDKSDALRMVEEKYKKGEIALDSGDYSITEFNIY